MGLLGRGINLRVVQLKLRLCWKVTGCLKNCDRPGLLEVLCGEKCNGLVHPHRRYPQRLLTLNSHGEMSRPASNCKKRLPNLADQHGKPAMVKQKFRKHGCDIDEDEIMLKYQYVTPRPMAQSVTSVADLRTGGRWLLGQYSFRGLMIVIATGFIPLSPLSVVSKMVMLESSQ